MNPVLLLGLIGIVFYLVYKGSEVVEVVNSKISDMALAIQTFEGWSEGSVSQKNNNPGNLKFAGQPGAISKDNQGHAIFDSYASGWSALLNQIRIAVDGTSRVYNPDMTFYQFFDKYAEANRLEYAKFVAERLNVSPNDTLRDTLLT
jgi:hypothetical protein